MGVSGKDLRSTCTSSSKTYKKVHLVEYRLYVMIKRRSCSCAVLHINTGVMMGHATMSWLHVTSIVACPVPGALMQVLCLIGLSTLSRSKLQDPH
eukprot:6401610-Amphidinium_carterae.1